MAALGSKLRPGVGPSCAWKDADAKNRLPWKGGSIALVVADSPGWCLRPLLTALSRCWLERCAHCSRRDDFQAGRAGK